MGTHAGLLRLAEDLVAQNTVSHPSTKEEDHSTRTIVADVVVPYLRKHGFTIRELPYWVSYKEGDKPPVPSREPLEGWVEKVNLVAQKGEGDPHLVLSAHMDTVSANPEEWTVTKDGPFKLTLQDGKYYGRGIADMKLFLALAMVAGGEIDESELEYPFALYFTSDEEIGCVGVSQLFGIQADGSRSSDVAVPKYVIIGEPTELAPVNVHKGYMFLQIELKGKTGHSAKPDLGRSVVKLALPKVIECLNRTELRLRFINDPLFDPSYPTLNQGVVTTGSDAAKNKVAEKCEMHIEIRPVPGQDVDEMFRVVQLAVAGAIRDVAGITAEVKPMRRFTPPMVTPVESEIVQKAAQLFGKTVQAVNYNTEGGIFRSLGAETVIWGPGSIDQAHKNDEYVSASWLDESVVQLYARAIREMCGRRR